MRLVSSVLTLSCAMLLVHAGVFAKVEPPASADLGSASSDKNPAAPKTEQLPDITVAARPLDKKLVSLAVAKCKSHFTQLSLTDCLRQYWAPRFMMDEAAKQAGLSTSDRMRHQTADLLASALVRKVSETVSAPSDAAVDAFIQKHPRDFKKPLRIRIFRLLTDTEESAQKLIDELDKPLDLATFRALCREHSVDQATHERGGDLGFVWPDGSTEVPQVKVDVSLYEAAQKLDEGEVSPVPVKEDKRFAVVWRRGSLPAVEIDGEAKELARARLVEQTQGTEVAGLLLKLEKEHVKGRSDVLLGKLRRKDSGLFKEP